MWNKELLSFSHWLRKRLQGNLSLEDLAILRDQHQRFREHFQQKIEMANQLGLLSPEAKEAYQYILSISWEETQPKEVWNSSKTLSWKGCKQIKEKLQGFLWSEIHHLFPDSQAFKQCRLEMEMVSHELQHYSKREKVPLSCLNPLAKKVYAWLCFVREPERLAQHIRALKAVDSLLKEMKQGSIHLFQFGNESFLWKMQKVKGKIQLSVHQAFVWASEEVLESLLKACLERNTNHKKRAEQFAESEEFMQMEFLLDSFVASEHWQCKGDFYDLYASFLRVNEKYFAHQMLPPNLLWSSVRSKRKMGHYEFSRDQLVLSKTLDHPEVPEFVIDYVVFHELLHKKHGLQWQGERRFAHTSAFLAEEKTFEHYLQAEDFLMRKVPFLV